MSKFHRPKRFRSQVLLLFLLVVMLPMSVLSVYLYNGIVRAAEARLTLQLESEGSQWLAGYQGRRAQVQTLGHMISNNPTLTNYMTSRGEKDAALIKTIQYSFRPMLEWLITTNDIVYRIHFFTANPELPEDKYVSQCSRHAGEKWFEEMCREAKQGRITPVEPARSLPYETSAKYPLVSTYQVRLTGSPVSYLQLDISADWMYSDISLAVDRRTEKILYSALDDSLVGQRIEFQDLSQKNNVRKAVEVLGKRYYWSVCSPEDEQVLFIHLVPADEVQSQLQAAQRSYLISCLSLAVLMLAMGWVITRHVTRRVDQIGRIVGQITQGQYLVSYTARYNDEIDRLGVDVQEMGIEMDRLVNQRLRQSLLTKEAEFRALQAQMNPHFIFNTLESFQMLAELEGLKTLSDMMALLGKLVRYNLEHAPTVPLRMEIENVADYIAVQNLNWNERIRLETQLDEALLDRKVLRLMLQPVVENAIVHGMPPTGELHISIRISQTTEGLRLLVANDGKPTTEEEAQRLDHLLQEASASPVSTSSKSIALQNIQRRLLIQYGAGCRIHIGQGGEQGFFVEFVLPAGKED